MTEGPRREARRPKCRKRLSAPPELKSEGKLEVRVRHGPREKMKVCEDPNRVDQRLVEVLLRGVGSVPVPRWFCKRGLARWVRTNRVLRAAMMPTVEEGGERAREDEGSAPTSRPARGRISPGQRGRVEDTAQDPWI